MRVPFPPWRPDLYDVGGLGTTAGDANGVRYGGNSYVPWPKAVAFSEALAAACRGAVLAYDTAGARKIFAGTSAKLYKFVDSATAWTDVTRSSGGDYSVASDVRWSFTQHGDNLIAVNINDAPQVIGVNSGTNFAALGGSPPNATIAQTVGQFVMLGGISGTLNQVRWSGRDDPTYWTAGQRDSDLQTFPDGGPVRGITPLRDGLIFQEGAIRAYRQVPDRSIFQFRMVERRRGLLAPNSLVTLGNVSFYLSEDGFYATDGSGQSEDIGSKKAYSWFFENVNTDRLDYVCASLDPSGRRIYWLFPGNGVSSEAMNYCLCYDVHLKEWTYSDDFGDSFIWNGQAPGYTLEGLDALGTALVGSTSIELFPISFDDASLAGGTPFLSTFSGSDFKMKTLTGAARAATLETVDFQAFEGRRAFVQGAQLLTDATGATTTFGTKERPQGTVSYGSAVSQTDQGYCPTRSSGRFHRVRVSFPEDESWTHISGAEVDATPEGRR